MSNLFSANQFNIGDCVELINVAGEVVAPFGVIKALKLVDGDNDRADWIYAVGDYVFYQPERLLRRVSILEAMAIAADRG